MFLDDSISTKENNNNIIDREKKEENNTLLDKYIKSNKKEKISDKKTSFTPKTQKSSKINSSFNHNYQKNSSEKSIKYNSIKKIKNSKYLFNNGQIYSYPKENKNKEDQTKPHLYESRNLNKKDKNDRNTISVSLNNNSLFPNLNSNTNLFRLKKNENNKNSLDEKNKPNNDLIYNNINLKNYNNNSIVVTESRQKKLSFFQQFLRDNISSKKIANLHNYNSYLNSELSYLKNLSHCRINTEIMTNKSDNIYKNENNKTNNSNNLIFLLEETELNKKIKKVKSIKFNTLQNNNIKKQIIKTENYPEIKKNNNLISIIPRNNIKNLKLSIQTFSPEKSRYSQKEKNEENKKIIFHMKNKEMSEKENENEQILNKIIKTIKPIKPVSQRKSYEKNDENIKTINIINNKPLFKIHNSINYKNNYNLINDKNDDVNYFPKDSYINEKNNNNSNSNININKNNDDNFNNNNFNNNNHNNANINIINKPNINTIKTTNIHNNNPNFNNPNISNINNNNNKSKISKSNFNKNNENINNQTNAKINNSTNSNINNQTNANNNINNSNNSNNSNNNKQIKANFINNNSNSNFNENSNNNQNIDNINNNKSKINQNNKDTNINTKIKKSILKKNDNSKYRKKEKGNFDKISINKLLNKDEKNFLTNKRLKMIDNAKNNAINDFIFTSNKKDFLKKSVIDKINQNIFNNPAELKLKEEQKKEKLKKMNKYLNDIFYYILNKSNEFYSFENNDKLGLLFYSGDEEIDPKIKIRYNLEIFDIYKEFVKDFEENWSKINEDNMKIFKEFYSINRIIKSVTNKDNQSSFFETIDRKFFLYKERIRKDYNLYIEAITFNIINEKNNKVNNRANKGKTKLRNEIKIKQSMKQLNKYAFQRSKTLNLSVKNRNIKDDDLNIINETSVKEHDKSEKMTDHKKEKGLGLAGKTKTMKKFEEITDELPEQSKKKINFSNIINNNKEKKTEESMMEKELAFNNASKKVENFNLLKNSNSNIFSIKKKIKNANFHEIVEKIKNDQKILKLWGIGQSPEEKKDNINKENEKDKADIKIFNEFISILKKKEIDKFLNLLKNDEKSFNNIINMQELISGNTLLIYATEYNLKSIVETLLMKGADPNIQNIIGNSPLHIAYKNDNSFLINLLVEYHANEKLKNIQSLFPYQMH